MFYEISAILIGLVSSVSLAIAVVGRRFAQDGHRVPAGTHVIISGGSKGIGKSLAIRYAELGAHVTIIARNKDDLDSAKIEVEKHRKNVLVQRINTVSLDLTRLTIPDNSKRAYTSQQKEILDKLLGDHDRCDILINCCGSAVVERFEDISQQQFRHQMDVNYFSAVNLTRLLLPTMKARALSSQGVNKSPSSSIVFVSSMCGLLSFFGYSAYSASKFALVGLAEALQMELKPFNINITLSFPPDTDTPGYEQENKTKPLLTSKISDTGNLHKPEEVASAIVADVKSKKFYSTVGIENHAVLMISNAFMPPPSLWRVLLECMSAGLLRLVAYFILRSWYKLVDEAAPKEIIKSEITLECSKKSVYDEVKDIHS